MLERLKLWFVCRYLRDRYNMSHRGFGHRRKAVLGAILDGIRAEFTEDNMPTALNFIVEEMLENSEDHQRSEAEFGKRSYSVIPVYDKPDTKPELSPHPFAYSELE